MHALDAANEPLSRDELEAATGIDDDTLDAEFEALQKERIVRMRGREPYGFHLVDEAERGNDDV